MDVLIEMQLIEKIISDYCGHSKKHLYVRNFKNYSLAREFNRGEFSSVCLVLTWPMVIRICNCYFAVFPLTKWVNICCHHLCNMSLPLNFVTESVVKKFYSNVQNKVM